MVAMVSPGDLFIFMMLMHGFAAFDAILNKRKRLRKRFLFSERALFKLFAYCFLRGMVYRGDYSPASRASHGWRTIG
jgi:hypothetical protein